MIRKAKYKIYYVKPDWTYEDISGSLPTFYEFDTVSDLIYKIFTGKKIDPRAQHIRGLTIPFGEWIEVNKAKTDVRLPPISESRLLGANIINLYQDLQDTHDILYYEAHKGTTKIIIDNPLVINRSPDVFRISPSLPIDKRFDFIGSLDITTFYDFLYKLCNI